jgi:DNA recombination-dependent growth factor C
VRGPSAESSIHPFNPLSAGHARAEATFLLYTNELGDLITDLVAALGGLQED